MLSIESCPVPANTYLETYCTDGVYADCYSTIVPVGVPFAEFIFAFYTTPLFRLERFILRWTVSKPSTDTEARALAERHIDKFAAWRVENRGDNEILMCDYAGRTRSWLMVIHDVTVDPPRTRLFFGSAVVPVRNTKPGGRSLGKVYQGLLGFHRIYSILLLYSAKLSIIRHNR